MSQSPADTDAPKPEDGLAQTSDVDTQDQVASADAPAGEEFVDTGPRDSYWRDLIWAMPSWLLSMILHIIVLLVLAMFYLPAVPIDEVRELILATGDDEILEELEDFEDEPLETLDVMSSDALVLDSIVEPEDMSMTDFDEPAAQVKVDVADVGAFEAPATDLVASLGSVTGNAFDGRGQGKARMVARDGGNDASEKAVSLALEWLARHQMPDGGWTFDHARCTSCQGQCGNPGSLAEARNAATALALLPFLGAGQTHKEGKYQKVVKGGLYYLTQHMKVSPKGGSLHEKGGRMYSHGLGAITLCEAYAMTRDKSLFAPAQASIAYIAYAQDPTGGGWRYSEQQPGDTSVVGWQIMALKSAHMGYLQIPPRTISKAELFLDSVQAMNGARYGYATPGDKPTTTAVGLLCRMHMGWDHDNPALTEGVKFLSDIGPSGGDMYYNYYATQVLRHYEGEHWKKWNARMRDQLVNSQVTNGHESGSWFMEGPHNKHGGRLYCTAMATMILEVYYRHLPVYRKQSTQEAFPID